VQARILGNAHRARTPVAVARPTTAWSACGLAGGPAWSYAHAIDARRRRGNVVVGAEEANSFALDAATGARSGRVGAEALCACAGDDGRTTVVTLAAAGESGSVVLAVAHDGTVVRQLETSVAVGVPARAGAVRVFALAGPIRHDLQPTNGEEQAGLCPRASEPHFHARRQTVLRESGLFVSTKYAWQASKQKASHVSLAAAEIPATEVVSPGTELEEKSSDAFDKISRSTPPPRRLAARIDADRFVATY